MGGREHVFFDLAMVSNGWCGNQCRSLLPLLSCQSQGSVSGHGDRPSTRLELVIDRLAVCDSTLLPVDVGLGGINDESLVGRRLLVEDASNPETAVGH